MSNVVNKVVLGIGDFHFGGGDTSIRTLLGSCIAITLWHPSLKIGGMCHYLLPRCNAPEDKRAASDDGSYAEGALQLFMRELRRTGTRPQDYVVKLCGGGSMFGNRSAAAEPEAGRRWSVPEQNIKAARVLLAQHGFQIAAEHVGGFGSRSVTFNVANGELWLRCGSALDTGTFQVAA